MSTRLAGRTEMSGAVPARKDFSCVVIQAECNSHITSPLAQGAIETLRKAGVSDDRITHLLVPGAVELVYAARRAALSLHPDAIIVTGCVIRGDTPHFDYVCQSVTQGVTALNAEGDIPVVFSVLTVENEAQALERAGGVLGNKGSEGAATAIAMANLADRLPL